MLRKRARISVQVYLLIILVAACRGAPAPASTEIFTSKPDTKTLVEPPPTPVWTDLPAPIQLLSPTPQFDAGPRRIDPTSTAQLAALTRLGKGAIRAYPSEAPEGMPVFSPDGQWIAIPTSAGIYIYDPVTWEELLRIPVASTFARSPQGDVIATAGKGGVPLWDPFTGSMLGEMVGKPDLTYQSPAFSPDGSLLSAAASNQQIQIWSVESGSKLAVLPGDRLSFSPDGSLALVILFGENKVRLYETQTWGGVNNWPAGRAGFAPDGQMWLEDSGSVRLLYIDRDLATAPFPGTQPSFSTDGSLMALFANQQISLYDIQKGRRSLTLQGSFLGIDGVLFSPDGRTLAGDISTLRCPTCTEMDGWERSLVLWRASDGTIIDTIHHPSGWISYAVDGSYLIAFEPEAIQVIDTADGSVVKRIEGFTNPIEGMALSPDGKTLAAAHAADAYALRLWDIETDRVEQTLPGTENFSIADVEISYSPDGNFLAVGGDFWDLGLGERLTRLEQIITEKTSCWSQSVSFSPDGDAVSTGCFDGQLDRWSVPDGWLLQSFGGYTSWVQAQAYSPDGEYLAAVYGTPDNLVQVWQLPDGKPVFTIPGGHFTRLAYSPDGATLATVLANQEYDQYGWKAGFVQLWRATDGVELARLDLDDAVSIAFSPDSRLLATGSLDGTLRIWELAGLTCLFEAKAQEAQIQRLLFTPDGTRLLTGSLDGTMIKWGIPDPSGSEGAVSAGSWQTYVSAQFGFEVDYPPGWAVLEVPNPDYVSSIPQVWLSANGFPPPQTGARADIVLMILSEDPSPSWQPEMFDQYETKKIQLANREALRISGINKESRYQETAVITEFGNYYILAVPNGSPESYEYFDQVLSTLH